MSEVPKNNLHLKFCCLPSSGVARISFFWVFFLINSTILFAQDFYNTTPGFQFLSKVDLPTVTAGDLNYQDLTIAIATGPDGHVYTLTFGKGVDKRDSQGNLIQAGVIPASQLDSPRDIAIDGEGYFYIADYLAAGETFTDNGKIRVFDPSGTYLPERTIYSSFYRPLGLDVKDNKVYVAEYYDGLQGPEKGSTFSRIRIYDKESHAVLKENENVELPIRIAVNSSGTVYVSQAGTASASVILLDANLNKTGQLPGIVSPGSVVVDGYDFVHVLEYGNRLEFSDFINFETLAFGDLLAISEQMMLGIQNEDFYVKVFNVAGDQVTSLVDRIDFPVDLAFDSCENFYVDNADIFGSYAPFFGYTPSRIEFDLEIYKRIPTFDAAEAPEITCNEDIEIDLASGEISTIVNFPSAVASDKCFVTLTQTKGLPSGSEFEAGEHLIEFTATDGAGNTSVCSFKIIVNGGEDLPPQFTDCPSSLEFNTDQGECGTVVSFTVPSAFDESGSVEVSQTEGLSSGSYFRAGEHSMVFEAIDDQGNKTSCSFSVIVKDIELPVIECPQDLEFTVDFGVSGKVVNYDLPVISDNCSGITLEQIAGLPSGSEFPIGLTINTYKVTDGSENSITCDFKIIITESADIEPPIITCPDQIFIDVENGDCGQIVNYTLPEVSDNSGEVTIELSEGPAPGDFFTLGTTSVRYNAIDGAGNTAECSFLVSLLDKSPPEIIECPTDQVEVISTTEFVLADYRSLVSFSDCSEEIVITQDPPEGTVVTETSTIQILAEDEAGNVSEACTFNLILEKEDLLITDCPVNKSFEVDESCGYTTMDYTSEVSTNHSATISQRPAPGTQITEDTQIIITAEDDLGNIVECSFKLELFDSTVPQLTCPGEKQYSFDSETGFVVPDYTSEISITDNCSYEVIQEPVPGTVLFVSQNVMISAIDSWGNRSDCEFLLNLTEVIEPTVEITSCPSEIVLYSNTDCLAEIPDLSEQISTNIEAVITQIPPAGTFIDSQSFVEITAVDAAGNSASCNVTIIIEDNTPPEISCGNDIFETLIFGEDFVLPDYRGAISVNDCSSDISIIQEPAPGTGITESTEISFIAEDASGNRSQQCTFNIILQEEVLEITECPASKIAEVNDNCSYILVDYTSEVTTNHPADILQVPAPGTEIYESTLIEFRAEDENGSTATCSVELTLEDTTVPFISCPGDQEFTFNGNDGFVIPDFRPLTEISDNCGFEVIQEPAPGSVIFESQNLMISAIDSRGNRSDCEFLVNLTEVVEPTVEITSCPSEIVLYLNTDCVVEIPDLSEQISTNIEADITQTPPAGTLIDSQSSVEIKAVDAAGNSASCNMTISIEDNTPPEISCGNDIFETLIFGEDFVLPDYRGAISVNDCSSDISIIQEPAPGTSITESSEISFIAEDASGNRSQECAFRLTFQEDALEITECPASRIVELNDNCSYILVDYTSEITTNHSADIVQIPAPGTEIYESTLIEYLAEDENGSTATCSFEIILKDTTAPTISCPGDQEFTFNAEDGFVIPDFRSSAMVEENCDFEVIQEPAPGSVIFESREIVLTVIDASGNTNTCQFEIVLIAEEVPMVEITSCAAEQILALNENCSVQIPDLTVGVSTNISADIEQTPAAGTVIFENSSVEIRATDEYGNVDVCVVHLKIEDQAAPEITCRGDLIFAWEPENGFVLPDFSANTEVFENCGNYTITQQPTPNTIITSETSEILLTAVDDAGNSASCSFILRLTEEEVLNITCPDDQIGELNDNCSYVVPDFRDLAQVSVEDAVITQEPPSGEVITSTTQITLTVQKGEKRTSCNFNLSVADNIPPEVACVSSLEIDLENSESVSISVDEIDVGSTDNCGIVSRTLSKSTFTREDEGEQIITLTIFDASGNESSCEVLLNVRVPEEPGESIQCVDAISLQMEEGRNVRLDARSLFTGGTGTIQYSVSKEEFRCEDIGEQTIIFNYVTPNEEGACEIRVKVEDPKGFCELIGEEPADPLPYVIIYPNPGSGNVKITTSPEIILNRAEVFDMRGRFLFARDFPEDVTRFYDLNLSMYESGVYTIKLSGEDKEYVRRAIVRND